MDYAQILAISASGMQVQKTRLEVAAHNLANINTVGDANGMTFKPLVVVAHAAASRRMVPSMSFDDALADGVALDGAVADVTTDFSTPDRLAHEPGNPRADANGMVRYPGINHLDQMMTISEALRAYEANIAVAQATKSMASRALEIGGNA